MVIKSLQMNNFRNYENEKITFSDNFNYIYGKNGAGKTNILEAMSFLSFGKSFLNSKENDCIHFGKDYFSIEGHYQNELLNEYILSLNFNTGRKVFSLNKERVNGFSSNIFGKFPLVYLTPHSLNITYGNPSERRKFFDIIFSQISPIYLDYLKELNKILKLKNTLLKELILKISRFEFDKLIDSYNDLLANISTEIIFRRYNFLNEFKNYLEKNYKYLTTVNEIPDIIYYSSIIEENFVNIESNNTKDNLKTLFKKKFDEVKEEEIARKITLIGPHRDDYIFIIKRKFNENFEISELQTLELKNFASQGEHKTYLIALKLSEYNFIKDKIGTNPILLLDDIMSELDSFRVTKIINYIPSFSQVFVTSTEPIYIDSLKNYLHNSDIKILKVENNKITSIN
ncbi:MAG: DNA replication and repair protein RecF [Ignavibacteria bacterium]|nr:DNA replication and repair protein RecF [Ignavibacteria bacterium]